MSPGFPDEERERVQEETAILMLRVGLALLGEARLRGGFGEAEALAERAAALATEFSEGRPSPDPERPAVEAEPSGPDTIALSASEGDGHHSYQNLRLDGVLFGGGGSFGISAAVPDDDAIELSPEERAEAERHMAELQKQIELHRRFAGSRYVRSIAAPPQSGAEMPVLAVELFEDGFYVEYTFDQEPRDIDPGELSLERMFAEREKRAIVVEDDCGTEYVESGGGGGGLRIVHSCSGFAPAPPAEARVLRLSAGGTTVELQL